MDASNFFKEGRFDSCSYEDLLGAFTEIIIETMRYTELSSMVKNHNREHVEKDKEQVFDDLIMKLKAMKVCWAEEAFIE